MSSFHKKLSVEGLKDKAATYRELIEKDIDFIRNSYLLEDCLQEIRRKQDENKRRAVKNA